MESIADVCLVLRDLDVVDHLPVHLQPHLDVDHPHLFSIIFAARQKDGKATEHGTIHQQKGKVYQIASFGEDAEGELYLLPLVSNPPTKRDPLGGILQLVAE